MRYAISILHALLAAMYAWHYLGITSQTAMHWIGALTLIAGILTIRTRPNSWPARINGAPLIVLGALYTGLFGSRIQLSVIAVLLAASALALPRPAAITFAALFLALLATLQFLYTGLKCTSRSPNSTPL